MKKDKLLKLLPMVGLLVCLVSPLGAQNVEGQSVVVPPIADTAEEIITINKAEFEKLEARYEKSFERAIEHYRSTIGWLLSIIGIGLGIIAIFFGLKVYDHYKIKEYEKEIENIRTSMELEIEKTKYLLEEKILLNNNEIKDLKVAIKKAIALSRAGRMDKIKELEALLTEEGDFHKADINYEIANLKLSFYGQKLYYNKAIKLAERAIENKDNEDKARVILLSACFLLAEIYLYDREDIDNSRKYIEKGLEYTINLDEKNRFKELLEELDR